MQHYVANKMETPDLVRVVDDIAESLKILQEEMSSTRDTCGHMGQQFRGWVSEEMGALRESHESREENLLQQFRDRFEALGTREQQLRILLEEYSSKLKHLQERSPEEAKELVNQAANAFKMSLDATLLQEREWLAQRLHQNEMALSSLEDHVREPPTAAHPDIEDLQQDLEGERAAAIRLTKDIQRLSKEAALSTQLHKRWKQDIQQVDSLRAKLSAAHRRMPRIEGIAAKLDSINRLNGLIHSTTKYFAKEKSWITEELAATAGDETLKIQPSQTLEIEPVDHDNPNSANPGGHRVDPVRDDRRVAVRSPWQDSDAPSPPPNVEQERHRRRDGAKPRPILRSSINATSSKVASADISQVTSKMESPALAANYSHYNHSVAPGPTPETRSTSTGYTDSIRNLLVSGIQGAQRAFTTLAEFEQTSKPIKETSSQESQTDEGDQGLARTESIHKISDRFKDPKTTSPGDLRSSSNPLKRAALKPVESTRPPAKMTQGRRSTG